MQNLKSLVSRQEEMLDIATVYLGFQILKNSWKQAYREIRHPIENPEVYISTSANPDSKYFDVNTNLEMGDFPEYTF